MAHKIELNIGRDSLLEMQSVFGREAVDQAIGHLTTWGIRAPLSVAQDDTVHITAVKPFGGGNWELYGTYVSEQSNFTLAAIWDERDSKFGFHS